ncbi:MAG: M3 family metallopeptidase [Hyphomicrobiaceae bacterium]
MSTDSTTAGAPGNPLLDEWTTPFAMPPFARISDEHFRPAYTAAFAAHNAEIAAIADDPAPATFENTIVALERAGRLMSKVGATFWNLAGSDTNDTLQAIEREMAPRLAAHYDAITSNTRLFNRIDALHTARDTLNLDTEQRRVLERTHLGFVRAGAALDATAKARMSEIKQRLASLGTTFSQNVLADEKAYVLALASPDDLAGLPPFLVDAASAAARERGLDGHVVTLSRSLIEPFLTFSDRRDLREKAFKAWIGRGESGGATDNRAIVAEILALRQERAHLLGYRTFADYKLDDTMAKTPARVLELLDAVWAPAVRRAGEERDTLKAHARKLGLNHDIEPWDWRYLAEKVRRETYAIDEAELKSYLPLEQVLAAAFHTAHELFGIVFEERRDLPLYHPDVRAWEVKRTDGRPVGLFLGDYFARPSKRSGAWMSSFRVQRRIDDDIRPIIVNVANFAKSADGKPALLSFDDARTLFHELGHGLHGLLSDVTYPSLAGTAVARDFVELPSQLYEHWLEAPEVLTRFARHAGTGEPMPAELLARLKAARTFNQGFQTIEYLASALVDIAFHDGDWKPGDDPVAFEAATLARLGMPREIVMRHRTAHFTHVFSGDGYSSGYYSYLWSEVLDADAFQAFEEAGNVFDRATADRLLRFVYAAGGSRPEGEAYIAFRGRLPAVDGLLRMRGLAA